MDAEHFDAPDDDSPAAAHFHALCKDLPAACAMIDAQGQILAVTDDLVQLLGYSLEELRQGLLTDVSDPGSLQAAVVAGGRLARGEIQRYRSARRYRAKDGHTISGDVTLSAVRDADGRFRCFLAAVHDATRFREAEDSLRRTQDFLNDSQRVARIGSYDFDIAAGTWTASAALEELFGLPPGEVHTQREWIDLLHPDDREDLLRYLDEEVIGRRQPFDREYRLALQRDGGPVWVNGRGALTLDATGRPVRMLGTIQDVTERKRAEEALRASERKYRSLIEQLNVGVFLTRLDGTFVHANAATARTAGYDSVQEFMAVPAARLYPSPGDRERLVADLLRDGSVSDLELTSVRKDGSLYPLSMTAVLLRDSHGQPEGILGVIEDITERKRTEEAVLRAQQLESLGVLAGGIAHDFNNLLAGVFGYLELAQEASTDPAVQRLLADALAVHGRARDLTRQLLTFARGGRPERKSGSIAPVLEGAARFALSGTNVSCRFDLPDDLRPCDFDRNQVAQVVDNLVINAAQAMPGGGTVTIAARNVSLPAGRHALLPAGDYVQVEIRDAGVGIPREVLPRIFDPFFTTKQKGSGLGLAMAHSVIRRHDGHIEADSMPGQGTTFRIWLPAGTAAPEPANEPLPVTHHGRGTVLLLDDEEPVRDVLVQMLGSLGYQVLPAATGAEALDRYATGVRDGRDIRCAIVDLTIPGEMGGIQVLERLRAMGASFPVFAASGYSEDPAVEEPSRFGFAGSLRKPFTRTDLARLLEASLGPG